MPNRSIEIPRQRSTSVISAYDMRKTAVSNMLKSQGISEAELNNFLMNEIKIKVDLGEFSVTIDKEIHGGVPLVDALFNNFSQYMILTRRFRSAGYTVTPTYKQDEKSQSMCKLTISWGNAVEKI